MADASQAALPSAWGSRKEAERERLQQTAVPKTSGRKGYSGEATSHCLSGYWEISPALCCGLGHWYQPCTKGFCSCRRFKAAHHCYKVRVKKTAKEVIIQVKCCLTYLLKILTSKVIFMASQSNVYTLLDKLIFIPIINNSLLIFYWLFPSKKECSFNCCSILTLLLKQKKLGFLKAWF